MNIDHIGFVVKNFKKSRDFYVAALAPLGLGIIGEGERWAMLGKNKCDIWFGEEGNPTTSIHVAFVAENHDQVKEFYEAAIAAGGKDNGKPDYCTEYDANYFAAFVIDINGHNLEAVCREP